MTLSDAGSDQVTFLSPQYDEDNAYLEFRLTVTDNDGFQNADILVVHVLPRSIGHMLTNDLWIRAVIHTVEKGAVDAVWQKGGEAKTSRGDTVIWGHFYASPDDVSWGSQNNPDLFAKIWYDASGRIDVSYFHVSVPDISVYSDYLTDTSDVQSGITTMTTRYIRQYYENGQVYSEEKDEDGNPLADDMPMGDPQGYATTEELTIGAIISTEEKGPVDAVWEQGGQDVTQRGDQVIWGHFYAHPSDVTWGQQDNPDLFVKIWFDVSGRIDANYFHVSVPDIEVYSDFPADSLFDKAGTTTLENRYIRHNYANIMRCSWTCSASGQDMLSWLCQIIKNDAKTELICVHLRSFAVKK
ncbi:MAG: hypothetical protein B6245_23680 [Desulfobacteraceae bacterium 4572_88]|nr:MAG: hypothetical protein B6245_23680 [Desulfobacteraceae bacterium 4572_88]